MKLSFLFKVLKTYQHAWHVQDKSLQMLESMIQSEDVTLPSFQIDSRVIQKNDVFCAFKGENTDGHQYIDVAFEKGAALALISDESYSTHHNTVYVHDLLETLSELAHLYKKEVHPKSVAITGSCGKTTVKEMLSQILVEGFGEEKVHATKGNFNNHIGLPLTILGMSEKTEYLVAETGMNHFGELTRLSSILESDGALVNNVLRAHIGCGFDGEKDIALAKSEIFTHVKDGQEGGFALLPLDDHFCDVLEEKAQEHHLNKVYFKLDEDSQKVPLYFTKDRELFDDHSKFDVYLKTRETNAQEVVSKIASISLAIPGEQNIKNALAAITLAYTLDNTLKAQAIEKALFSFKNAKGRVNFKKSLSKMTIIDDTYNANPDSMKSSADILGLKDGYKIFVMGDMGELGENMEKQLHEEVGAYIFDKKFDEIYFVGTLTQHAYEKTQSLQNNIKKEDESMKSSSSKCFYFASKQDAIERLQNELSQQENSKKENISILVKGSRFMKMEEIVEALLKL